MSPKPGALVVFEGAEGVGKTTQIGRLALRALAAGLAVTTVREPGGTPLGDEVRQLLLHAPWDISPEAETLLYLSSRAQLVNTVLRPALGRGELVLLDRFFLSTYAYQAFGRGLDVEAIRSANEFDTGGLKPTLTILLDLPSGDGLARAERRGEPDRLERSGAEFHARVRDAFREFAQPAWQAAHMECGPIAMIDASGSPEEVENRVIGVIGSVVRETFGPVSGF